MTQPSGDRRAALALFPGLMLASLVGRLGAQPLPQTELPSAWQAIGVLQIPVPHGLLRLQFDEIVLPGAVPVLGRSGLRFTQAMWLFKSTVIAPTVFEQLATRAFKPGDRAELRFTLQAEHTVTLTLLAQTPAGWFRTDRELKVGRAAK